MGNEEKKRGPKPETLKIEGDWKNAVNGALKKKRPASGWPKQDKWVRTPKIRMPPR